MPHNKKEKIGLILEPTLFLAVILIPTPQSMNEVAASISVPPLAPQIALGTMFWMVVWWVTECVPLGLTGLLAPLIFVISGILSIRQALSTFSDPIIWIFIAGFILAATFQRWGLDRRIAYSLALLYRGNNPKIATFFVASLPVFMLTMTGSITASTVMVFPFAKAFMRILNISVGNDDEKSTHRSEKSKYAEASFVALGQAATAGAVLLHIENLAGSVKVDMFRETSSVLKTFYRCNSNWLCGFHRS